jgi:hypothetical protein
MRPQLLQQNETSELTSQVVERNPADCETQVVIAQSLTIARRCHSVAAYFEVNKPWIIELRQRFEVSQGQPGHTLNIEGNDILWREFVETYFGISLRWMNELLQIIEKPEPSPKPIEEKPLYQKGFEAGRHSVEGTAEIDRKLNDYETKIAGLEKQIAELKTRLKAAKTRGHTTMLSKLIEAVLKEHEGLPDTPTTLLARNLRTQMEQEAESTPDVTQKIAVVQTKQTRRRQGTQGLYESA